MRKSILVTAAIAVTAGALALAFSQTEQGKTFFGTQPEQTTQEIIASAATPETTDTDITEETASAEVPTETATETSAEVATAEQPTMAPTEPAGMTPINLNEASPAAGESVKDVAPAETAAAEEAPKTKIDIAAALQDRSIGSANAPVTVYDFSSLTCPHCAHFHNEVLPKIKADYIDTGKVRWVFHGFPLNEPALKGEMIARCAPADQYEKLQDLMYQNQQRWAFSDAPIPSLGMLVRLAGVTDDMFLACANNDELQAALLKKYQEEGDKFKINSTPTFVFNNGEKTFSGAGTYEGFAFDLDELLKAKKAAPVTPATTPAPTPAKE